MDECKSAFEHWMRSTGETPLAFMESNGCYADSGVQKQWIAFKAAWNYSNKHSSQYECAAAEKEDMDAFEQAPKHSLQPPEAMHSYKCQCELCTKHSGDIRQGMIDAQNEGGGKALLGYLLGKEKQPKT